MIDQNNKISCSAISISRDLALYYAGPGLVKSPLPAVFYFAASAEDSLCREPFNHLVEFLYNLPIHIFSLSLPGHEAHLPTNESVKLWAEEFSQDIDRISPFINQVLTSIDYVIDKGYVIPEKIGVAGLSRGGFIAAHIAAKNPKIRHLLQFAPLIDLTVIEEFKELKHNKIIQTLNLLNLKNLLYDRHIRIYIGNRDLRVGTKNAFNFMQAIVDTASKKNVYPCQTELLIQPSIGNAGHGTSLETFKEGGMWLSQNLLAK